RAGKASVVGDGLAIAQVTREDLVDQHVGRLTPMPTTRAMRRTIAWGLFTPAGAAANLRSRSRSIARICSRTTRSRAKWRRSSARVFSSNVNQIKAILARFGIRTFRPTLRHCSMAAIPTAEEEDVAKRSNRERGNLVTDQTRIVPFAVRRPSSF